MIQINMNDYVYVKLTQAGKDELKEQYYSYKNKKLGSGIPTIYQPPPEDSEGWSKWQFHDIMSKLGWMCTITQDAPFDPIIRTESFKDYDE